MLSERVAPQSAGQKPATIIGDSGNTGSMTSDAMKPIDENEIRRRAAFVAEKCEGIQPPQEVFYLQSILYAADRAHAAFVEFDVAVAAGADDAAIFALVQEALAHAGALSRFFWPMRQGGAHAQARGDKLREAFDLTDASPLKERRLRNAFEHFDEHLDRFLLVHDAGTFFPNPRVGDHTLADEPTDKIFKLVDPSAGICVLLGEKFAYGPIRAEVDRVLGLAGASGDHGRLPQQGETLGVDPNEAYGRFHAKWAPRLGLKDRYLEEAFKRGRDPNWAHSRSGEVPHTPGEVRILLKLDSATMLGSIEPAQIDGMVEEWEHQLAPREGDHREITRKIISEHMALNRHRGEEAELLLCGAVWLIITKDDTQDVIALMRRGDAEVCYDIAFLDDEQATRFRLSWRDLWLL